MLCFVKRDGDVHSDYTTPEPQQVRHLHPQLVQQRCSQLNKTQVSFFFFLGWRNCLANWWMDATPHSISPVVLLVFRLQITCTTDGIKR